jgi:hypothetical protein
MRNTVKTIIKMVEVRLINIELNVLNEYLTSVDTCFVTVRSPD